MELTGTRKMLVAFDPKKDRPSSDFLIPWKRRGEWVLLGLKSGKPARYGLMVYITLTITAEEILEKAAGARVPAGDPLPTLAFLDEYVRQLQGFKIGNIVRLPAGDAESAEPILELVAKTPSGMRP